MVCKTIKLLTLLFTVLMSSTCTGASRHRPDISRYLRITQRLTNKQPAAHKSSPPAAAASTSPRTGRSLKQFNFDPYGYGYYDPYVAGVTPGFVNVDINRETGLFVGVGDVAVDVSADKNFVGVGVGNLVGVGAARDRGWNLQLAGGNVLDASVTKDAGLGLWVLDGLLNINIGPEAFFTGTRRPDNVAAQNLGSVDQTPVEITAVTVDDGPVDMAAAAAVPDLQQQEQQYEVVYPDAAGMPAAAVDGQYQEVVVDESMDPAALVAQQQQQQQQYMNPDYAFTSTTEINPPFISTTDGSEVNQIYLENTGYPEYSAAPPAPAPPAAAPIELQLPSYDFMDLLHYDESADQQTPDSMSSMAAARLPAPTQQPAAQQTAAAVAAAAAAAMPATSQPPVYSPGQSLLVARPAAAAAAISEEHPDAEWSVASQYSDTQQMSAARMAATAATAGQPALQPQVMSVSPVNSVESSSSSSSSSGGSGGGNTSSRRACEGGVQLWTNGNKFKCKYKKPPTAPAVTSTTTTTAAAAVSPVRVAANQYTYANGVAV